MPLGPSRSDYAFPFRISLASGQAAQSDYGAHVEQMVRQVLLTAPGERVNQPEFGCGLLRMLFSASMSRAQSPVQPAFPGGDAASASAQILVQQALGRWLAGQIKVEQVIVVSGSDAPAGELSIEVRYRLLETQDVTSTRVRLI